MPTDSAFDPPAAFGVVDVEIAIGPLAPPGVTGCSLRHWRHELAFFDPAGNFHVYNESGDQEVFAAAWSYVHRGPIRFVGIEPIAYRLASARGTGLIQSLDALTRIVTEMLERFGRQ